MAMSGIEALGVESPLYYVSEADSSGYAVAARRCIEALRSAGFAVTWDQLANTFEGRVRQQPPPLTPPQLAVVHCIPTAWPKLRGELKAEQTIGHTVWEVDRIPLRWRYELSVVDELWVPTNWNKWVFDNAQLGKPVHLVPHAISTASPVPPPIELRADRLNFALVSAWDWRKRPDLAIEAYLRAFTADDPVTLVVKSSSLPIAWPHDARVATIDHIAAIVSRFPNPASVLVDTATWTDGQMLGLLRSADCLVSLTSTEGWGLGAFDAACMGTPIIITGYGGQVEWLGSDYPGLLPFSMQPVDHPDTSLFEPGMSWGSADIDTAVDMLKMFAAGTFPELSKRAVSLAPELLHRYAPTTVGAIARRALGDQTLTGPVAARPALPRVLILTPVKDSAHESSGYVDRLLALDYPAQQLSVGVLESDSVDGSFDAFAVELKRLSDAGWRTTMVRKDFGYRLPNNLERWEPSIQLDRRRVLALSRNHLLFAALGDEDWVLWIDADVVEFPTDIIGQLLAVGRDIVQPHCVRGWGGPTFDLNGWIDHGQRHLDDFRGLGTVELHAVGGTMLLVRADRHRDGLIWPAYLYGNANDRIRRDPALLGRTEIGEIETEGLAIMANDMGIACWGIPDLEIRHR